MRDEKARELVKQVAELIGGFNIANYIIFCRNLDLQGLGKRVREVHRKFVASMERIVTGKEETRRRRRPKQTGLITWDLTKKENAELEDDHKAVGGDNKSTGQVDYRIIRRKREAMHTYQDETFVVLSAELHL